MSNKAKSPVSITPGLLKLREKRKWQIALRRYVLEKNLCVFYAPYFGLDIENIRLWFEKQFSDEIGWEDFGKKWQFDHIIPVMYFDFSDEQELKLCWNFTNLQVEHFKKSNGGANRFDLLVAKAYFDELYRMTLYQPCLDLLEKINKIELFETISSQKQQDFINNKRAYLEMIEHYSAFEFELLNSGRTIDEVKKEVEFFKKFNK